MPDARYLGSRVCFDLAMSSERQERVDGMRKGYYEMGQFWHKCTDMRHKRMAFISKVNSPAISGLTACCWRPSDSARIDQAAATLFRIIVKGQGTHTDEKGQVICAMSNAVLFVLYKCFRMR